MKDARRGKLERELAALEAEYRDFLIAALRSCTGGHWGLFAQNDHLELGHFRDRIRKESGADRLFLQGAEIEALRTRLGIFEPFVLHSRFLSERGRRDANRWGEPKLARQWLDELEAESF